MSNWFMYFLFYSFAGYLLEKLFAWAVRSDRQVRKCFLLLPLCPVYGLAMTALLALAPAGGFWRLSLIGGLVFPLAEYFVHLFYDKAFNVRFWDYTQMPGHLQGRVCPLFTLIWGVLSALTARWIQPGVEILAERTPPEVLFVLWLVLAADCVLSGTLLLRYHDIELLAAGAALAQSRAASQSSTS